MKQGSCANKLMILVITLTRPGQDWVRKTYRIERECIHEVLHIAQELLIEYGLGWINFI